MRVVINDLKRYAAQMEPALLETAAQVIRSGHYVLGSHVKAFEEEFARYCGVPHCLGVANGTEALELALRAAQIGPGDAVVVAANAAMYGTTAVLACGAEPVFCDVDPGTGLINASGLEAALSGAPLRPKVVIVTHLYGRLADMHALLPLTAAHQLTVIEDCAQAHGATGPDGRRAGAFGDLATFSFYPTKNLGALGDGGAVTTRHAELAERLLRLRQYGWTSKYHNEVPNGRNSRLDELQAAFLSRLLPDLDRRNAARREIANRYSQAIKNPWITVPAVSGTEFVAHLYVVQVAQRGDLQAHLAAAGIGTDVHYPIPDYRQPVHGDRFTGLTLPITEALCDQVVTLPCFPEMTTEEVAAVITACNTWRPGGPR